MKYDIYVNSSISFYPNINVDISVIPLKNESIQYCMRKTYPKHSLYTEESLLFTVGQIIITAIYKELSFEADDNAVLNVLIDALPDNLNNYYLLMTKIPNQNQYEFRLIPVPDGSENNKIYFKEYLNSKNALYEEKSIRYIFFMRSNEDIFKLYNFKTYFKASYKLDIDNEIHMLRSDEGMLHRIIQVDME